MAGTLTVAPTENGGGSRGIVRGAFVVSSSGALTDESFAVDLTQFGRLIKVIVEPTTGGATQPTDSFEFSLVDGAGLNIMGSTYNCTNGAPTAWLFNDEVGYALHTSSLTPVISSGGESKTGSVVLILDR